MEVPTPPFSNRKRSARPRTVDRGEILAATLTPPPTRLGVTHWSSRLLADYLKVDASTVLRTWRHYRVQPWRAETFKFLRKPTVKELQMRSASCPGWGGIPAN
jgi:hypothetical protein